MRKIVVFGATGDLGRYFIDWLLCHNADYDIYAVGHRKEFHVFDHANNVLYYSVDITSKEAFSCLPHDVYAIVDFAGMMPARMKGYDPQKYIDVNITGMLNILEYGRQNNIDRIFFMQSFGDIKDYGESDILLTAHMPRKFNFASDHTVYVLTKNFAVDLLKNYHQMYGIKNFIFRLPTIYLYSKQDRYYVDGVEHRIGYRLLMDKAASGDTIEVWGDGSRVKDMIYVKDFCQMLHKALESDRDGGYYNVGTGEGTSLLDQIKGIIQVFGNNNPIKLRPDKPNAPQYIMDITPAKIELNYKPQYDYIAMLKDIKEEMHIQRLYKDM